VPPAPGPSSTPGTDTGISGSFAAGRAMTMKFRYLAYGQRPVNPPVVMVPANSFARVTTKFRYPAYGERPLNPAAVMVPTSSFARDR
jgi:hypothetical protein